MSDLLCCVQDPQLLLLPWPPVSGKSAVLGERPDLVPGLVLQGQGESPLDCEPLLLRLCSAKKKIHPGEWGQNVEDGYMYRSGVILPTSRSPCSAVTLLLSHPPSPGWVLSSGQAWKEEQEEGKGRERRKENLS